ncbi:MAG: recombination protein O N-terminal domain-containing protein [Flavobacteriales bacterium]|nr:recombination protein O N-terminal domain-containing protein [Flavobacteriales bacterium]
MTNSTEGIILNITKYGESDLIFNCLSFDAGVIGFFYKNGRNKKKKVNLILPLSEVEVTYVKKQSNLQFVRSIENRDQVYIYQNVYQYSIKLFLSQIIIQCIQDVNYDVIIYDFIRVKISELNELSSNYRNYVWRFMLDFTQVLGFYPNIDYIENSYYFDVYHGVFTNEFQNNTLNKEDSLLWKKMFDDNTILTKQERKIILQLLLDYYSVHVHNFKVPTSLTILEELFE